MSSTSSCIEDEYKDDLEEEDEEEEPVEEELDQTISQQVKQDQTIVSSAIQSERAEVPTERVQVETTFTHAESIVVPSDHHSHIKAESTISVGKESNQSNTIQLRVAEAEAAKDLDLTPPPQRAGVDHLTQNSSSFKQDSQSPYIEEEEEGP